MVMRQMKIAFIFLVWMTVLTGFLYPLLITGIANVFFSWQANGSMIERQGKIVGSQWIGQSFTSPEYFWGRPSATEPFPYNGASSLASNQGPSNPTFLERIENRVNQIKFTSLQPNTVPVPADLVNASASGLDPEISPLAAYYQIPRIAKARQVDEKSIRELISSQIQKRDMRLLGEPRVNVLKLNLALDNLRMSHERTTPNT